MDLAEALCSLLGQAQPSPVALPLTAARRGEDGVIEWAPTYTNVRWVLQVRGERVLLATVTAETPDAQTAAVSALLTAVREADLAGLSPQKPMSYVAGAPAGLERFDGYALTDASLAGSGPSKLTAPLLDGRLVRVTPCFRCEVPDDVDVPWARAHLANWHGSELDREPRAAFRSSRTPPRAKKPAPLAPGRSGQCDSLAPLVATPDTILVENYARRSLRFAGGHVALVGTEHARAITGLADARAVVRTFVETDAFQTAACPPDALVAGTLYRVLEAGSRDVVDGVEPVDITERSTRAVVARLWVQRTGDVLTIHYERRDPRLTAGLVEELVSGPYLHELTKHAWRAKVSTLRIVPRSPDAGPVLERAYPEGK